MKKLFIVLHFLFLFTLSQAQVGINTTSPSSRAALEVNSQINATTYGGFLPPRITVAQRDAMPVTAADDGMIAYVTLVDGSRCLQLFNGATLAWESIQCFAAAPVGPTTIFNETMGTAPTDINVNAHHAALGFANSATCIISSSTSPAESQIRNTQLSTVDFPSASGLGNLYFTNTTRDFLIENINVTAYTGPLTLQFLVYKSTNASTGSELTVEYYNSATSSWVNVSFSDLPTGIGSAKWHEKVLSTTVPNTIQRIRISRGVTTPLLRIDDIKIIKP